jgi:mRNA interferase HicA
VTRRYTLKQKDLVDKLEKAGFVFERHGSNHDIYVRGIEKEEVPRHKEIDERLAKAIIKRRGL